MIDDVVSALDAREWPEYIHRQLGPRVGTAMRPWLRPVVGAVVAEAGPVPVGASKLGGLPDVDGSFVWPTEAGTDAPLTLVCQLDLASRVETGLPGMLYLFSIHDGDRAYGYEIDETTTRVVHAAEPGRLSRAARPDGLRDDALIEERGLTLAPSLIADDGERHVRFDYEVEQALDEELVAHGGAPCGTIRLLGRAHPFRDETREQLGGDEILLLYLNGYATDRHAFGEGEFHVVISPDDLAAGQLDRATVLFEPGT